MATITLTFPDAAQPRIVDALCGLYGWTSESGLTRGQFSKQCTIDWLRHEVMRWEEQQRRIAMEAAVPPVVPVDVT